MYGPIFQSIPKEIRKKNILLNGKETVELDYSACLVRMIYHRKLGSDYHGDPYLLHPKRKQWRNAYKLVLQILLNADAAWLVNAAISRYQETGDIPVVEQKRPIQHWTKSAENHHEAIKDYFRTGIGLEFMKYDSDIMINILLETRKLGIHALPIHDSVICEADQKEVVKQIMIDEYRKYIGFEPIVTEE